MEGNPFSSPSSQAPDLQMDREAYQRLFARLSEVAPAAIKLHTFSTAEFSVEPRFSSILLKRPPETTFIRLLRRSDHFKARFFILTDSFILFYGDAGLTRMLGIIPLYGSFVSLVKDIHGIMFLSIRTDFPRNVLRRRVKHNKDPGEFLLTAPIQLLTLWHHLLQYPGSVPSMDVSQRARRIAYEAAYEFRPSSVANTPATTESDEDIEHGLIAIFSAIEKRNRSINQDCDYLLDRDGRKISALPIMPIRGGCPLPTLAPVVHCPSDTLQVNNQQRTRSRSLSVPTSSMFMPQTAEIELQYSPPKRTGSSQRNNSVMVIGPVGQRYRGSQNITISDIQLDFGFSTQSASQKSVPQSLPERSGPSPRAMAPLGQHHLHMMDAISDNSSDYESESSVPIPKQVPPIPPPPLLDTGNRFDSFAGSSSEFISDIRSPRLSLFLSPDFVNHFRASFEIPSGCSDQTVTTLAEVLSLSRSIRELFLSDPHSTHLPNYTLQLQTIVDSFRQTLAGLTPEHVLGDKGERMLTYAESLLTIWSAERAALDASDSAFDAAYQRQFSEIMDNPALGWAPSSIRRMGSSVLHQSWISDHGESVVGSPIERIRRRIDSLDVDIGMISLFNKLDE